MYTFFFKNGRNYNTLNVWCNFERTEEYVNAYGFKILRSRWIGVACSYLILAFQYVLFTYQFAIMIDIISMFKPYLACFSGFPKNR